MDARTQILQRYAQEYADKTNAYNRVAGSYNDAAEIYNAQLAEYKAMVEAYNQKVNSWNTTVRDPYNASVNNYNNQFTQNIRQIQNGRSGNIWGNNSINISAPVGDTGYTARRASDGNWYVDLGNGRAQQVNPYSMQQGGLKYSEPFGRGGTRTSTTDMPLFYNKPGEAPKFTEQAPGDFAAQAPEPISATPPADPGFTKKQIDQLSGKTTAAQLERTDETPLAQGLLANARQARQDNSITAGLLSGVRSS